MSSAVNMPAPAFDGCRPVLQSAPERGFLALDSPIGGWVATITTPQPALSAVFGIRELVCPGGQDSTAIGGNQLAVQPSECLGPPIIGPQPQNQLAPVLDDSPSLVDQLLHHRL